MLAIFTFNKYFNEVELDLSNLEKLYAEFATARLRFKHVINSYHIRLVRSVFCIFASINNFNKKNL